MRLLPSGRSINQLDILGVEENAAYQTHQLGSGAAHPTDPYLLADRVGWNASRALS